jgi:hypothetical protein
MKQERPIYLLRLQPLKGVDAVRALRWILKRLLRDFGMKTISIKEEVPDTEPTKPFPLSELEHQLQHKEEPMRSSDAYPSKFLKSADVKAKHLIATISYVAMETIGQDKKEKPVIYLETGKPVVCNRTNFEAIEDAFGDSDDWAGKKIKIFCAPTSYQGKRVDGIRVEPIAPKPALKNDLNDEVPL